MAADAGGAAADARLLARLAAAAGRVLSRSREEDVFAAAAKAGTEIVAAAGADHGTPAPDGVAGALFDLVYAGGDRSGRLEFALASWRLLREGGTLVFPDLLGHADIGVVVAFALGRFREIERIDLGPEGTNLAIVRKGAPKAYANWNRSERRAAWQVGDEDLETTLRHLRGGR